MMLIDTSVLVAMLRDRSGRVAQRIEDMVGDDELYLCRFTQLELLQGCRDAAEWARLEDYLAGQDYLELEPAQWSAAAKLYFDLRRAGLTVRSVIDCCIAQLAIDNNCILLHGDRDFETIAKLKHLKQIRLEPVPAGFHEGEESTLRHD